MFTEAGVLRKGLTRRTALWEGAGQREGEGILSGNRGWKVLVDI